MSYSHQLAGCCAFRRAQHTNRTCWLYPLSSQGKAPMRNHCPPSAAARNSASWRACGNSANWRAARRRSIASPQWPGQTAARLRRRRKSQRRSSPRYARSRLTARFEPVGGGAMYCLRITLDSDEPLAGLDVTISEWRGIEFNTRVVGVVVPPPGESALRAYCYDSQGTRAGLRPHESIRWKIDLPEKYPDKLRLELTCHDDGGESWDVVIDAPVQRSGCLAP